MKTSHIPSHIFLSVPSSSCCASHSSHLPLSLAFRSMKGFSAAAASLLLSLANAQDVSYGECRFVSMASGMPLLIASPSTLHHGGDHTGGDAISYEHIHQHHYLSGQHRHPRGAGDCHRSCNEIRYKGVRASQCRNCLRRRTGYDCLYGGL